MASGPLIGWRAVQAAGRRTAEDFAEVLRRLVEELRADAREVVLVTDNLNAHTPACLCEAFAPARARAIAERIEWHYTPKHGSRLNVAEIGLVARSEPCLGRRIAPVEELEGEVSAWQGGRNERGVGARWQFTTAKARVKLHRPYPSFQ